MIECGDDEFTLSEDSFCGEFFDFSDQYINVENERALLAMERDDCSSDLTVSTLSSVSRKGGVVVKASTRPTTGAKLRSKAFRQRNKPIDNNMAINSVQFQRDAKGNKCKFFAFPTYAASDTLLFLPSIIASCINSADTATLSRLLLSHLDKDCEIKINLLHNQVLDTKRFLKFHDVMTDLHPDSIMCVHSSKFVNNQLCASLHLKFTDSKIIYDSVSRSVTDPVFRPMFSGRRALSRVHMSALDDARDEVKNDFQAFLNKDTDFTVYVRVDMTLTIDETSKKVTHYQMQGQVTSTKAIENVPHGDCSVDL